ncbi:adventurous gliding motility protein CglE [Aggregicoccus sp. 17bor-14]|uniref:adventurous gliding motility protein CglE n=1 Tax=Myxococcaceae TaxID=31 RepID=UPI00129C7561|nr:MULTISPECIES: adventurous gliding motility protein CglE [Myxococcaceae]MBF5042502.1 adventurous gliding motility protein CglE [Simulacricoccus sp. 17bor-14]MRI88272.1 adventurous gliding motility protein CglE [Aggregicoccus sp. 17bor-14]
MNVFVPSLLTGLLLLSTVANAQGAEAPAAAPQDRAAVTFNEIERGLYFGLGAGPFFLSNPPSETGPRPFSSGLHTQVSLGVDLGTRLSIEAFLHVSSSRAGAEYTGNSGGSVSGDFTTLAPGAALRARLVGFADSQEVVRTWIYLRAGAGYAMFSPKQLLPDSDILVFGGPGVEYYTRLRHFSVGLEVTGTYLVSAGTYGFAVTPNLRYAF